MQVLCVLGTDSFRLTANSKPPPTLDNKSTISLGPLSFPRSLPLNFFHRRCDELHTHTRARKTLVPCLYCIFIFTRRMRDRGGWKWNAEAEETKQAPKRFRGKREDCRPPSSYQQFLFPRHQNFRPLLSLLPTLHVLISYRTQCSERERI